MPKLARSLSPIDIKRLSHDGRDGLLRVPVGGVPGLLLQMSPGGGKAWLLRTMVGARRREFGLGSWPTVGLAEARDAARLLKRKIQEGIDPAVERNSRRIALGASPSGPTFAECVDLYLASHADGFRNRKHRDQWRSSVTMYAIPIIGKTQISKVNTSDVLSLLQPIWSSKTTTANRLRGRIEAILDFAAVVGHRSRDAPNPARWRGHLDAVLPAPGRVSTIVNQPAVALSEMNAWYKSLVERDGIAAKALQFLTLCASRSGEVRGATWGEVDLNRGLWTIPAPRMKGQKEHRVPLTPAALAILNALPRASATDYLFPAKRGGPLSDMALSAVMRRMHEAEIANNRRGWIDPRSGRPSVPHGLRSSFRDWAAERTSFPREMVEIALAHRVGSAVELAYFRADMLDRRRALMEAWSNFVLGVGE